MFKAGDLLRSNTNISSPCIDLWEKIPEEIKELLWFTGDVPKVSNHSGFNKIEISFEKGAKYNDHILNDPSTIYFVLPVQVPSNISLVEKLSYSPSYARMNPEQRYIYLTWLQDVTSDIDIGYRFVFYYGLERRLIIGDLEKSFDMITRLRKATGNTSFLTHSANALLFGALKSNDADYLEKLRFLFDDDIWIDIQIITKIFMKEPIEPEEIPRILKAYSVNKRYLNEPVYSEQMRQILIEKYGQSFLTKGILEVEQENKHGLIFANYSFPENIRVFNNFRLPAIDEPLSIIKELHIECHERTKNKLAKLRRKIWD